MKRIGLLGGISWHSTLEYYRVINQEIQNQLGAHHSADMVLTSVDFEPILKAQLAGQYDFVERSFLEHVRRLEQAGCDLIALGSNTSHFYLDKLQAQSRLPFVSLVDAVGGYAQEKKYSSVALLGTLTTMNEKFYQDILRKKGLQLTELTSIEKNEIHRTLMDELTLGIFKPSTKSFYRELVDVLFARGAQAIIMGCTEIPLILKEADAPGSLPVPLIDTLVVHAKAIVREALGV